MNHNVIGGSIAFGAALVGAVVGLRVQKAKRDAAARAAGQACACDTPADPETPVYLLGGAAAGSMLVSVGEIFVGILSRESGTADAATTTAAFCTGIAVVSAIGAAVAQNRINMNQVQPSQAAK